jgi:16S rRNA (adenine1518-N6/adenine1519-N6)-dimethyltransferase
MSDSFPPLLPPLRDVIRQYELSARKKLGQNFLLDLNLTDRIARAAGDLTHANVIEIGPGPGGLTRALLDNDALSVIAVERDPRSAAAIRDLATHYPGRLTVVEADALKIDIAELAPAPRKIIANLPYNIATPLMLKWLKNLVGVEGLTLMFQREVADRLAAQPRTKAYGRLTIITQWLCEVHAVFNLPKDAFTPPPKVMSTVVNLTPRRKPLGEANFAAMEAVTAAAFGQRRKMLRASLKSIGLDPIDAGITPTARAEELSVEDFCTLARLHAANTPDLA